MNVEQEAISHLESNGIRAFSSPPADRPGEFATVEMTGREPIASGFACVWTLAVQAWAGSDYRASELMAACERAMRSFDAPDVARVEEGTAYRFTAADGHPRYQAVYQITANI